MKKYHNFVTISFMEKGKKCICVVVIGRKNQSLIFLLFYSIGNLDLELSKV